jgi:hypothetical protein
VYRSVGASGYRTARTWNLNCRLLDNRAITFLTHVRFDVPPADSSSWSQKCLAFNSFTDCVRRGLFDDRMSRNGTDFT